MKKKEKVEFSPEQGEIVVMGQRGVLLDIVSCCEKLDEMLGTGAEVVVHHMWYGYGCQLLKNLTEKIGDAEKGKVLEELAEINAEMGLGVLNFTIIGKKRPYVEITVKNPPFKKIQGSVKRCITSLWAGIFSEYFQKQMVCEESHYDQKTDTFTFTLRQT